MVYEQGGMKDAYSVVQLLWFRIQGAYQELMAKQEFEL